MSDFKETCIWMSYRYAIGRKSIASVCHAAEIAKHMDWVDKDRWKFTAEDIYNEINNKIGWSDNLQLSFEGNRETDAFSVLFEWFSNNKDLCTIDYFRYHKFHVNLETGDVEVTELETPTYEYGTIFHVYSDYRDWIKLAKAFEGKKVKVRLEIGGVEEIVDCYEYWDCTVYNKDILIKKVYSKSEINEYMVGWQLSPEYIKEVIYE